MILNIPDTWLLFSVAFGVMLLATYIMGLQSARLFTMHVVKRRFTIMDLEFPSSPAEMTKILTGIYRIIDPADKQQTIKALKGQLLIDFILFMPAAYGGIFIMSMKVAEKMSSNVGKDAFIIFAWAQLLCFVLDIIENIYIWKKIRPDDTPSSPGVFAAYKVLEKIKWGFPLLAAVSCFSSLLYFWITGQYAETSYKFILIVVLEVAAYITTQVLTGKSKAQ